MIALADEYREIAAGLTADEKQGLSVDVSWGKPSAEQMNMLQDLPSLPGDVKTSTSGRTEARHDRGDLLGQRNCEQSLSQ